MVIKFGGKKSKLSNGKDFYFTKKHSKHHEYGTYNTNCLLFCTERNTSPAEVDNADRACEVCILTEGGLVFRDQNNKQLVLYLLTGRYIYKTLQLVLNAFYKEFHPLLLLCKF